MQIVVNELLSLNRHPGVTVNVNIKNNNNNKNQLNVQARDWVCPLAQKPLTTGCQKVEDIKGEGTPCTHPVSHRCPLLVTAARRGDLCLDLIHLLPSSYVKWTVQKSWSVLGSQGKAKLSRSIWSESQCCKSQVKDQRIRENKKAAEETTRRPWINPRQVRSLLGVTGALARVMTEIPD